MRTLNYKKSFAIKPKEPFHFDGTFHKPSHFPNNLKLDDWIPGKYWQTLRLNKKLYGLKVEDKGTVFRPNLKISIYSDNKLDSIELEKIKQEIIWRFELNIDLKEFAEMAKKDKRFYPIFKKWLGMRNSSQYTLYELLIIAIVLQNATVRRSQQMLEALLGNYGTAVNFGGKELYAIWPQEDMAKVSEQDLRNLKVGYRAKFIKRLSEDFTQGKVDEFVIRGLDSESAKKELMKLYGVGPETARILLFEAYHHFDVFDHIAPWQQKIYSRLFYNKSLVPANKIRNDIKKRYGKYSMLAVHYIWEDVFWKRKNEHIPWLEKEIRL
ncbi:MAG: hypothetical protein HY513_04520 [Candidatus Aenigmarchaeota archaeon]|nr:hypothetical protein [Candidatus Aenigmarchaeota archaeon]